MEKIKNALMRFMSGRRGADQLGMALIVTTLILSLLASIFGIGILSLLTTLMWVYALFRMFSRNIPAREKENQWFLSKYNPLRTNIHQAGIRFKNRKVYLYYRCPQCRAWLRLPRNIGEKKVTCGKCGATFTKKA